MKYKLPFQYKDRQIGVILEAEEEFTVACLVDNYVAIESDKHKGYPLDANIFKLFAVKIENE